MDGRTFALMAKKRAVDENVASLVRSLRSARFRRTPVDTSDHVSRGISSWIKKHADDEGERSAWFLGLNEADQKRVEELMAECSETAVSSLMCLIDGVDSSWEGVFEIVAIDQEDGRTVINPENTEFLHDLFSEVCEEQRNPE